MGLYGPPDENPTDELHLHRKHQAGTFALVSFVLLAIIVGVILGTLFSRSGNPPPNRPAPTGPAAVASAGATAEASAGATAVATIKVQMPGAQPTKTHVAATPKPPPHVTPSPAPTPSGACLLSILGVCL